MQELIISVAIDFSYNLLIQTDMESQVSQLIAIFKPILLPIFVSFKRNKSIYKYFRNPKILLRMLEV